MTVRESLVEAIRECDVVGEIVRENGHVFVDVSIDKIANDLAPKIEAALRAQWLAGFHAAIPTADPEPTLTAGIEQLSKEG